MSNTPPPSVLIIGGKGALGSVLIHHFKREGYWVASVDRGGQNTSANYCISLQGGGKTLQQQVHLVKEGLETFPGLKFDGIISVAGGWIGGNLQDVNFLENVQLMWEQSVVSSLMAASLSTTYLKEGGLLLLTGAHAALAPTPGMIAYGMAKAAVHNLAKSLGEEGSGLPKGSKAIAILPVTLDTPNNRSAMPDADLGTWTSLEFIASLLQGWMEKLKEAPESGSLVGLITKDGETVIKIQ